MHRLILAVAVCSGLSAGAAAQPAPTDPSPPTSEPAAPIAPPAPDASPKKVEDAKDIAQKAKLTPIVPSPNDATRPAFQLYAEVDLPILAIGLVVAGARVLKTQKAFCAPLCDPNDLNALDRTTAGYWNPAWSTSSDLALYALGASAAALMIADEGALGALNDGVVVAESAMSAMAVSSLMTLSAGRPRPFAFGEKAPLATRNSADAGLSFLSSHTSISFAIATSLYITERRLHPKSNAPRLVLGIGYAAASFVAVARVLAGQHFITDVGGGAIVGTSVGWLVSSLHASPVTVVPVVSDTARGVAIVSSF